MSPIQTTKMTNYRWAICTMLFLATTINYMDRQVLSLTYPGVGGIESEFHWTDANYGIITMVFSLAYAVFQLLSGKFIDWMGTKKGYLCAIGIWSVGACLHALCGVATENVYSSQLMAAFGTTSLKAPQALAATGDLMQLIAMSSMWFFLAARCVLALGEAGNFPAAIKVTAEYFPKKDRAFATAIFNNGASVGALVAPFTIPLLAKYYGWEMAFVIIGALGFIWMGLWIFVYKKPNENPHVNKAELTYINQDADTEDNPADVVDEGPKISLMKLFTYRQTWSFIVGKFMTDGVWWFFLFWTPAYLSSQFSINPTDTLGMVLIFTLYLITMLSILGGYVPTYFVEKLGMNPYHGRMRAMLIFACFPLLGLLAQPLGNAFNTPWFPIVLIGILGAAHQSWSANIYSTVGDMFPKSVVATVTGIGGMAGGFGSALINGISGWLFTYADHTQMHALGFTGKPAGYMIIFCFCSVAYLIGWCIMKILVPKYKPIVVDK